MHQQAVGTIIYALTVVTIVIGKKKLPRYHEFMMSRHLISEHFPANEPSLHCSCTSLESRASNTVET
jgi:hypothetical protein